MRPARNIGVRYDDPLDVVWCAAARGVGLRVVRSPDVYASTDGRGTLVLGAAETLDADDCMAQMVFHELCHSLVQGVANLDAADWGLDNESERDVVREHACLRLQAMLAGAHGLREFLAPTTDFRAYYDALPRDPMTDDGDPAVALAREAFVRVDSPPWGPWVRRALAATERIVDAAHSWTGDTVEGAAFASLYGTFVPARMR